MTTALLFKDRMVYPDGAILETRIWRLPEFDDERPHGLKYSLYYRKDGERDLFRGDGERIICYDNECGKGDHRHYNDHEEPYEFTTAGRLVEDFLSDVRRERSRG
jgi:hypothetical protein